LLGLSEVYFKKSAASSHYREVVVFPAALAHYKLQIGLFT